MMLGISKTKMAKLASVIHLNGDKIIECTLKLKKNTFFKQSYFFVKH